MTHYSMHPDYRKALLKMLAHIDQTIAAGDELAAHPEGQPVMERLPQVLADLHEARELIEGKLGAGC